MRFSLIDRITDLREGESVTAIKVLTLSEEYLADHFPRFPGDARSNDAGIDVSGLCLADPKNG